MDTRQGNNQAARVAVVPGGMPAVGDVLALVTSISPWSPAAEVAAQLAASWGGMLTGCYIDPAWRELAAAEAESMPLMLSRFQRGGSGVRLHGSENFSGFARAHGVRESTWSVARAGLAHTLRQLGAWHDLAVIERDMVDPDPASEVLGEALLGCHTPCLLLPQGCTSRPPFTHIAVGWNGSLESIRALHAARPLLMNAHVVGVVDGAIDREGAEDGLPQFDPCQYLSRLGISVYRHSLDVAPADSGPALLEAVATMRADLLVMGAYGRSRLRERVVGGATRHVLGHAELPLLMQH